MTGTEFLTQPSRTVTHHLARLRSGIACDENGERDIDDESLRLLKERGIRRLAVEVLYNSVVGEDAVRAFCIGEPETADTVAPDRSLFLHHADLSFEFLQQLAQVRQCAKRMLPFTGEGLGQDHPPTRQNLHKNGGRSI